MRTMDNYLGGAEFESDPKPVKVLDQPQAIPRTGSYQIPALGRVEIQQFQPKTKELDPNGLSPHAPGAKLDAGKVRPSLVLGGFARALLAVSRIGTGGAAKYTDNGWMEVPNGLERYDDAKLRHWLYEKTGVECDPDTNELHAAHEAWNALARLDLILRAKEAKAVKL